MIDYQNVEVIGLNIEAAGTEEILRNLKVIFTTPKGTVPFDRSFGLDLGILDGPITLVQGRLIAEYTDLTRKYEPRAQVKEVYFGTDPQKGVLIPKVVVSIGSEQIA